MRARGVLHADLYGSVARDQAGPDSDIDVVVEIAPGIPFSLLDQGYLCEILSEMAGRDVDVKPSADLPPELARRIAGDRYAVF